VLGAPVLLMPSWFLIALVITVVYAPLARTRLPDGGPATLIVAFTAALLLLGSVFLHELSHALAARAVGTPPSEIVLDLWGGHTAFDQDLTSPGRSAFVSLVGPATNGLLAVLGIALQPLVPQFGVAELLLVGLTYSNGLVAVFNALPGLPLDGGRVLEALIWKITGNRVNGTVAAGWTGRALAAGLAFWAVGRPLLAGRSPDLINAVWLLLIAWMLWQGATQALTVARWRRNAPSLSVSRLARRAVAAAADGALGDALARAAGAGAEEIVLLDRTGRPVGVVDGSAVRSVPPDRLGLVPARAVSRALPPAAVVPAELTADALLSHLRQVQHHELAVLDAAGRVVGVLHWNDVVAALTAHARP
jgi:Zn-dependent protease